MTAEDDKPIGELKPRSINKWRGLVFTLGGMGIVIVGVVLAIVMSTSQSPPASGVAGPGQANRLSGTAIGKDGNPKYNQQVVEDNERRAVEAQRSGHSFVPTPVGEVLPSEQIQPAEVQREASQPAPAPPPARVVEVPTAASDGVQHLRTPAAPYRAATQRSEAWGADARGNLEQYLTTLSASWQFHAHVREVVHDSSSAAESPATSINAATISSATVSAVPANVSTPASVSTPVRVGDVLYAVNAYEVDSDVASPVVARVVSGDWRDATLVGQFKLQGEHLVLEFNQLARGERLFDIKAVAVDPQTQRYAVRSEVDHHRLARWGSFLAGSWLATFGEKLEQSGTTTVVTTGAGGTTTVTEQPEFDTRAINQIALGRLGREVANEVRGQLSRPPTVKLRALADLGVLILSAPQIQQPLALNAPSR
jgi:hypothetical protein